MIQLPQSVSGTLGMILGHSIRVLFAIDVSMRNYAERGRGGESNSQCTPTDVEGMWMYVSHMVGGVNSANTLGIEKIISH